MKFLEICLRSKAWVWGLERCLLFQQKGAMSLLSWSAIICLWHNHSVLTTGPHLPPPTLLWSIGHTVTRESFVTPSSDFQCDWKKNQTLLDGLQGLSGPWPRSCFPFGYTLPAPSHCLPDAPTLCSSALEYRSLSTCWLLPRLLFLFVFVELPPHAYSQPLSNRLCQPVRSTVGSPKMA